MAPYSPLPLSHHGDLEVTPGRSCKWQNIGKDLDLLIPQKPHPVQDTSCPERHGYFYQLTSHCSWRKIRDLVVRFCDELGVGQGGDMFPPGSLLILDQEI